MNPDKVHKTKASSIAFWATFYGLFVSAAVFWRMYSLYANNSGWQEGAAGIGLLLLLAFTVACGLIAFFIASRAQNKALVKVVIAIALLTLLLVCYLAYLVS